MSHSFSLVFGLLVSAGVISAFSAEAGEDQRDGKGKSGAQQAKAQVGEDASAPAAERQWADWVEKDFPFFSSVLDCREVGEGFPKDNLTPRGIILNLGHNIWACFDTDLLRIACIWEGEEGKPPITLNALAPGSYHVAGQKTKDGQENLPKPVGKVWLANGIYPGWQVLKSAEDKPSFTDPREPGESKEEVGRGPLKVERAGFQSAIIEGTTLQRKPTVTYHVGTTQITETFDAIPWKGKVLLNRHLSIAPHRETLVVAFANNASAQLKSFLADENIGPSIDGVYKNQMTSHSGVLCLRIEPSTTKQSLSIQYDPASTGRDQIIAAKAKQEKSSEVWPQTITFHAVLSASKEAYVLDDIPLPLDNPWKRNVRLADIDFLDDQGNAVGVTFDGDVWLISGLKGDLAKVTWKRFASGLHEPMSVVVRKSGLWSAEFGVGKSPAADETTPNSEPRTPDLLVFDRNGIWKLLDTNNDAECDRYEMFCNLFAQTAETREFPNSMKLGPKGELYISKGGQEGTTRGKHNGTVIKVAPDGKSFEVIGYGLRQPFIGVHPKTGLVTASDQQGHYVPSTPLHIISDHHFYGHLPTVAPKEQYPETITEPLAWIPHPVNPSGVTQVWLTNAQMGPLNDELIHIGYNRPELFRVLMKSGATFQVANGQAGSLPRHATVMSFWRDFDFPPLNAKVNPADGQLYVVGFQVWGTTAKKISGLARIRYTGGERVLLKECTPMDKGVLLRFNAKLDAKLATDPASFSAERWNYKRTPDYGSPHLKLDGSPGQEWMNASSAYLSKDGYGVFVGIPDMKAGVHQMRIGWGLKSRAGLKAENTGYFSPWELATFDPVKEGFGDIQVDLTPRKSAAVAMAKPTEEEGQRLYQMIGCMACHSTDGTTVGKVGPSWKGIFGSERDIGKLAGNNVKKPMKVKADEDYLRESITHPSAKVVKGFEKFDTGMPIYAGILNESQIESLVLYIKSLK